MRLETVKCDQCGLAVLDTNLTGWVRLGYSKFDKDDSTYYPSGNGWYDFCSVSCAVEKLESILLKKWPEVAPIRHEESS